MTALDLEFLKRDRLAMSVAHALSLANDAALEHGTTPAESLITISEEPATAGKVWRIHYGPRDYVGRRGGDLIVLVDEHSASVQQVIHGQ
jgi:hypothetical protein